MTTANDKLLSAERLHLDAGGTAAVPLHAGRHRVNRHIGKDRVGAQSFDQRLLHAMLFSRLQCLKKVVSSEPCG